MTVINPLSVCCTDDTVYVRANRLWFNRVIGNAVHHLFMGGIDGDVIHRKDQNGAKPKAKIMFDCAVHLNAVRHKDQRNRPLAQYICA